MLAVLNPKVTSNGRVAGKLSVLSVLKLKKFAVCVAS